MSTLEITCRVVFLAVWGLALFGLGSWFGYTYATFNQGMKDLEERVAKSKASLLKRCSCDRKD